MLPDDVEVEILCPGVNWGGAMGRPHPYAVALAAVLLAAVSSTSTAQTCVDFDGWMDRFVVALPSNKQAHTHKCNCAELVTVSCVVVDSNREVPHRPT